MCSHMTWALLIGCRTPRRSKLKDRLQDVFSPPSPWLASFAHCSSPSCSLRAFHTFPGEGFSETSSISTRRNSSLSARTRFWLCVHRCCGRSGPAECFYHACARTRAWKPFWSRCYGSRKLLGCTRSCRTEATWSKERFLSGFSSTLP